MAEHYQFRVEVDLSTPVRVWSGTGDHIVGTKTFTGTGGALGFSPYEMDSARPTRRLAVQLSGVPTSFRQLFLQDPGPQATTVEWILSTDEGATWTVLKKFVGQLSAPAMTDGVIWAELETLLGDVDRGVPARWSNEDQQARSPGDRGMGYFRQLADAGIEVAWPP